MIINPNKIVENGTISNITSTKDQVQQNGIDLTVNSIYKIETNNTCVLTEKTRVRPNSKKVELQEYNDEKGYMLKKGEVYDVLFNEDIKLDNKTSGMIIQRSSLNRMGSFVTTGWWDSGFENKVGAIIRPAIDIFIGENTRLAQFIAFESEAASLYDGIYKKK